MNEDTLVTGHYEGTTKIWNIGVGFTLREQLTPFESSKAKVKKVNITHDNTLYVLGSDGKLFTSN